MPKHQHERTADTQFRIQGPRNVHPPPDQTCTSMEAGAILMLPAASDESSTLQG